MKTVCIEIGMPYIVEKWLGGCLTNFIVIKKSIKKYNDLIAQKKDGKLEKYTKKERLEIDREIAKLEIRVGGLSNLIKVSDVVFIWDIKKEKTAMAEAKKLNIPVIGVCDTNVNPEEVDYVIPANDDATKTIKMILNLVKEAALEANPSAGGKK